MSFTFRNLFSEEGGDPEVESESGLSGDANPFSGDPDGVRGTQPSGSRGESARGPSLTMLASELLALIPPAISAQSGIPMSKEITVPLPAGGSHEVSLSTIYQLCPELFAAEITPLNDSTVTLPARLGEIGSAGSGRARVSLSDGLAAASPASAFSSEGFLPKGFSPAGTPADEGVSRSAGASGSGEPATRSEAVSGPMLHWGAGPAVEKASDSPKAPAAGSAAAETKPFSTPSPIAAEADGFEKATEEPDDKGREDALFGASPFKGGDFATLFSKQAEADREIPFPESDLPEGPPPGFGEYFLSGGESASEAKDGDPVRAGSAPPADDDQTHGAPTGATHPSGEGDKAKQTASSPAASEEPPRGSAMDAPPFSDPTPTATQGGPPAFSPVEPAPLEGFSPSPGLTLEWPSADPEEKKDSAATLDAEGGSQFNSGATTAEMPSGGPASAETFEGLVAASGFDTGGTAHPGPEAAPARAKPTVSSHSMEEGQVVHRQAAAGDPELRDLEFRALFSSDESFTLAKVARRIVEMPGIKVCSLATPGRFVKASTRENESLGDQAKEMSEAIRNLAKLTGLPDARCFTLHSDQGTVSLFVEGDCCLTVNHDETAFGPGVRERLILIARSIHKLEG